MKQDEWDKWLEQQLKGHQEMPEHDLWAGVEASLSGRRSRFVPLRRWAAAAAILGVVAGGALLFWQRTPKAVQQTATVQRIISRQPAATQPATEQLLAQADVKHTATPQHTVRETMPSRQPPVQEPSAREETQLPAAQPATAQPPAEEPATPQTNIPTRQPSSTLPTPPMPDTRRHAERRTSRSATVNLYAGGGANSWNGRNGVQMSNEKLQNFYASARAAAPVYLADYEERQSHSRPVSLGLTASYPLTCWLSVSTGMVYTKLNSDFLYIMHGSRIKREQELHYIGIPLNVQLKLWGYRGFKAYLAAGGEIDWNVKNHTETEGVRQETKKDDAQWSVGGSLGLQYNIIPPIGIYVEPGVRHYFDNGSDVRNFFKDKPTDFNLQFGVRVNL